jgi:hypothetical protein
MGAGYIVWEERYVKIMILERSRPHDAVIQKPVDKSYRLHLNMTQLVGLPSTQNKCSEASQTATVSSPL